MFSQLFYFFFLVTCVMVKSVIKENGLKNPHNKI